jgi:hypothetical protein
VYYRQSDSRQVLYAEVLGEQRASLPPCNRYRRCLGASALTFPPLAGHVVDEAGILDQATRAALAGPLINLLW